MLECVCGYVSNQVEAFDWPDSEVMFHQYLTMMCLWCKLGRGETVAAKLWGPAGVDTRSDATQTPSRHTGTAIEHIFLWKEWWRITHVQKKFCPDGLEGAFALYHLWVPWGSQKRWPKAFAVHWADRRVRMQINCRCSVWSKRRCCAEGPPCS